MPNPISKGVSKKFAGTTKKQGYTTQQHQKDVTDLLKMYTDGALNLDLRNANENIRNQNKKKNEDLTKQLLIGKSADAAKPGFFKGLRTIRNKISGGNVYNQDVNKNSDDANYWYANIFKGQSGKKSKLKGAKRIHEKAVQYKAEAIASNNPGGDDIFISNVRDILRATIVFESINVLNDWCGTNGKQDNIIDIVDSVFPVLRVKNRFVGGALPMIRPTNNIDDLSKLFTIETRAYKAAQNRNPNANVQKLTRDTFYRDIQMLVLLENGKNGVTTTPLSHHIAEVQISVKDMMTAKDKGHEPYEHLRVLDGYIDMKLVAEDTGHEPLKKLVEDNKPGNQFVGQYYSDLKTMVDIYRNVFRNDVAPENVRKAINNSNWAKANQVR